MMANSYEHNLPLHAIIIDFKQTYDSMRRTEKEVENVFNKLVNAATVIGVKVN